MTDILLLAQRAARVTLPQRLHDAWLDDVAQETAIMLWRAPGSGWGLARLFARRALRCVFGDRRYRRTWDQTVLCAEVEAAIEPARSPSGALALVRLQRIWPTLTDLQRDALLTILDADRRAIGDVAAAHASSSTAAIQARRRALERIDHPGRFHRRARVPPRGPAGGPW